MSATGSTTGLSEPEKVMHEYLNGFVKAINEHNFSYIEKYLVKGGAVYNETKDYIKKISKKNCFPAASLMSAIRQVIPVSCICRKLIKYRIIKNHCI